MGGWDALQVRVVRLRPAVGPGARVVGGWWVVGWLGGWAAGVVAVLPVPVGAGGHTTWAWYLPGLGTQLARAFKFDV